MTPTLDSALSTRPARVSIVALLIGGGLLGVTLNVRDGTWQFYAAGFAMAATWIIAYLLARTHVERDRRATVDALIGVGVGVAMFGVFAAGSWVLHRIHVFDDAIDELLRAADASRVEWVLVLAWASAVAEELFFRGTLIDATRDHFPLAVPVVLYVATTVPSGNPALVAAAAIMGTVFTVLRICTGTFTASIATHLTWSTLMILVFPR